MIIGDKLNQARERLIDDEKQAAFNMARDIDRLQVRMDKPEDNPTEFARQLGKRLSTTDFESRVSRLNPSIKFLPHPVKDDARLVMHEVKGYLFPYTAIQGTVNEFSWMNSKEEIHETAKTQDYVLKRSDLPPAEWVPHEFNEDGSLKKLGRWIRDENVVRPGFEKKELIWNEVWRGWRTVLLRLIFEGYLPAGEVEREFGSADRKSWATKLGKIAESEPSLF